MMVVGAVTIVVAGGEGRRELAILIVAIVKRKKTWLYVFIFNLIKRGIIVFILGRKNMKTEMCVYLSSCYLHFADLEMKYAAVVFKRIRLVAVVIESHYPL